MPTKKEQATSTTYANTMPNAVEAEQNILCCIMRDEARQMDIIAQLRPSDFYQPNHAIIFEAMWQISNRKQNSTDRSIPDVVNFATVTDCLRRNGKLAQAGDFEYLSKLDVLLPSTAKYKEYLQLVKRASIMRQLITACGEITQKAYSSASAEDALQFAEKSIFDLSQGSTNGGLRSLSEVTASAMLNITNRYKNPDQFRGIQTGFVKFDNITNGLHGGELIVLAARPGIGKSALAMNIAENVSRQNKTVAVFSLEMSNEQIIERMLSSLSSVPLSEIKSGRFTNGVADIMHLKQAQDVICSQMSLFGNDTANITTAEIASQCRRLKAQQGLDLVVIDYIQLMSSGDADPKQGRQNEVAAISRNLKLLAKELDVPVIALSQLKRDAETRNIKDKDGKGGGSEPVLSDLRESGAIEQDADIVLFIHKETDGDGVVRYKLIIAKHRNGEQDNVDLIWLGQNVRFVDEYYLRDHNIRKVVHQTDSQDDLGEDKLFTNTEEETSNEGGFINSLDGVEPQQ